MQVSHLMKVTLCLGMNINRPLYVNGLVGNTLINWILLDCGSVVKFLPLRTLRTMGMNVHQPSLLMLTIQGFNHAEETQ